MIKIAIALLIARSLTLSFNYKETNPASLFPYYTAASDTAPFTHLSNPAYLPLWNTGYLSFDYGKPYHMEEMNSGNIRAGYSNGGMGFQAAWNRFGITEYYEDIYEAGFGFRPWKYLSLGAGLSYYHLQIGTEEIKYNHGSFDINSALLLLPFEWISIGFIQENFLALMDRHKKEEDYLYPNQGFGIAVKPARGITLSWNVNKIYYGYINSFSVSANVLPVLSLKSGYSKETSSYSFSLSLICRKLTVAYGMSYHTYLGATHKLGVTIASMDYSLEQVEYKKRLRRLPVKKKRININTCTMEMLIESGLFSPGTAERIMRYRNTLGPLSRKSLIQLGFSEKEFKVNRNYITGLTESPRASDYTLKEDSRSKTYEWHKRKGYSIDTRKQLFKKLLENGLDASAALKVAELARENKKGRLIFLIKTSPDIPDEKKDLVIEICTGLP